MRRTRWLLVAGLAFVASSGFGPAAEAGGPRYCFPHGPHGKIKCKKMKFKHFDGPKFKEHKFKGHKFKFKD